MTKQFRNDLRKLLTAEETLSDSEWDKKFGIDSVNFEETISLTELIGFYGNEDFEYEGARYNYIRQIFRLIEPKKGQVFYDLGSGYGRILLYGSLISEARFIGIEIVKERVLICNQAIAKLGIKNAVTIHDNVLNCEISDGDFFFIFNPFFQETLTKIVEVLFAASRKKKIIVISYSSIATPFSSLKWLLKVKEIELPGCLVDRVDIYESQ